MANLSKRPLFTDKGDRRVILAAPESLVDASDALNRSIGVRVLNSSRSRPHCASKPESGAMSCAAFR